MRTRPPTVYDAPPDAKVITLTHAPQRFQVPAPTPTLTADTDTYTVTTITLQAAPTAARQDQNQDVQVTLQGTTPTGEFIDMSPLYTTPQVLNFINLSAPKVTLDAVKATIDALCPPAHQDRVTSLAAYRSARTARSRR